MRQTTLIIVLILGAGLAQAQDVPKRKSGLWEVTRTTTRTENRPVIVQWCVDEQTDNALAQIAEGLRNESCTVDKMSRDGDRLTVDAVCKVGREQVASKTHAVITGKFDSAYKVESKSSYDPPMRGNDRGHGPAPGALARRLQAGSASGRRDYSGGSLNRHSHRLGNSPLDRGAARNRRHPQRRRPPGPLAEKR